MGRSLTLSAFQRFEDEAWVYRITVPRVLMEECPTDFKDMTAVYNSYEITLTRDSACPFTEWVELHPESIPVLLMRLAFLAAYEREGPIDPYTSDPPNVS